jgi:hypothetical protein
VGFFFAGKTYQGLLIGADDTSRLLDSFLTSFYASSVVRQEDEAALQQLSFEGLAGREPEPIVVEHCIVTSEPIYSKLKKGAVWECAVHVSPDLFHQEQDDIYQLHATIYATEAKKKRLRPGDIVTVIGTLSIQRIALQNGTTQEVKHLAVTELLVVSRAPRKTVTVYEAEKKKQ